MADYKDIITGTIGNIIDKVKEVASSDAVRNVYEQGTSKAKAYGRIAKLTLEVNGQNEELKKVYTEIGKLYFEQAKEAPEGFFAPLFAQAEELSAAIAAKEEEIASLKPVSEAGEDIEVEIEVEAESVPETAFDRVVTATEGITEDAPETPEE